MGAAQVEFLREVIQVTTRRVGNESAGVPRELPTYGGV